MLAQTHTTGPVTQAIAAMRLPQDDAITALLTERASALSEINIGGLISLIRAHERASDVFTAASNQPRSGAIACQRALEAFSEHHAELMEHAVAELEARTPSTGWERDYRRITLAGWYADREDWPAVQRIVREALAESVA